MQIWQIKQCRSHIQYTMKYFNYNYSKLYIKIDNTSLIKMRYDQGDYSTIYDMFAL